MSEIKAWNYHWRISKEEYEKRKLVPDDHCGHNSMEWASLTLTDKGLFACVSDYGDYIYMWHSHCRVEGQDFREFVCEIDGSYLLGKTRRQKTIEQKYTAERLGELVRELRECHNKHRAKSFDVRDLDQWCNHGRFQHLGHDRHTAEWAKECLERIDSLDQGSLNELYYELDLPFDSEDIHHTYSPQALTFAKHVLPQLQRMIREELAAEKAALAVAGG